MHITYADLGGMFYGSNCRRVVCYTLSLVIVYLQRESTHQNTQSQLKIEYNLLEHERFPDQGSSKKLQNGSSV